MKCASGCWAADILTDCHKGDRESEYTCANQHMHTGTHTYVHTRTHSYTHEHTGLRSDLKEQAVWEVNLLSREHAVDR